MPAVAAGAMLLLSRNHSNGYESSDFGFHSGDNGHGGGNRTAGAYYDGDGASLMSSDFGPAASNDFRGSGAVVKLPRGGLFF